ncbi:F-box/LRR-repeat protein 7 [Toxocara canis]|uniref:F-box/LRR-repeat protein 7 n=1 Tax=Toxocara canis TaxID=6265 RepID=A0A0B2UYG2_TOXCA|nr:F-box/LRR-repeat protein 7 [Toxocara canis]
MTAIFDMTRRVTMYDSEEGDLKHKIEQEELTPPSSPTRSSHTIEKLPDKVLQQIFSYLSPNQVLLVGQVCRRWKNIANSPSLWQLVSFRPFYGGIQVTNQDFFTHLIGTRFTELRVAELATDLITPNILHEMAAKCPRLQALTLDFSTAMQLHDFTDLQNFPSRLRSLTICLSENIFLEGFLRKVYTFISSVEVLHIIGTYEKVEDEEEEVYETVNVHKLKQYMPNIRVVNLWGVPFIADDHVDAISSNCAHLECLCVNYCTKVTGSCLRLVLQRCKKLRSLLLAHTTLDDKIMQTIEWEKTRIEELNICGTELSSETLKYMLTRLKNLTWLDASWLEDMNDQVVEAWMASESIANIKYLNLDTCDSLNEACLTELITRFGHQILGLNLGGHHKLLEYFWMNMIPKLRNIRVLVMGIAEDCCPKVIAKIHIDQFIDCIAQNCPQLSRLEIRWDDETLRFSDKSRVLVMGIAEDCCPKVIAKIHIDQFIDCIAQNCPQLSRLEIRWDDETLRFSDKSSKFIDVLRMKCLKLHSMVLSDGQYYELIRSNFERADRMSVVRTTEMCRTGLMHCSRYYNQLLFN